jgi:hypothetical protein
MVEKWEWKSMTMGLAGIFITPNEFDHIPPVRPRESGDEDNRCKCPWVPAFTGRSGRDVRRVSDKLAD